LHTDELNVLMLGDVIGSPGLKEVFLKMSELKKKEKIHLVIANGENADEGFGISEGIIKRFRESGIDVITSGNHIWAKEGADELLDKYDYLLRPANYPFVRGKGWWSGDVNGIKVGVVNVQGRYFMTPIDCPFQVLSKLLKNELRNCNVVIVDFHAEYVAEKKTFAHEFDGKVSLVAGTHTHVQTADETILPKGTGYITDLGICGGIDSIIGMRKEDVLKKVLNQEVVPYIPSKENTKLQGIVARIDPKEKRTISIKRINL
jgi:2',3'-cyclic-nucleotide 2'-phosphodiesterase